MDSVGWVYFLVVLLASRRDAEYLTTYLRIIIMIMKGKHNVNNLLRLFKGVLQTIAIGLNHFQIVQR